MCSSVKLVSVIQPHPNATRQRRAASGSPKFNHDRRASIVEGTGKSLYKKWSEPETVPGARTSTKITKVCPTKRKTMNRAYPHKVAKHTRTQLKNALRTALLFLQGISLRFISDQSHSCPVRFWFSTKRTSPTDFEVRLKIVVPSEVMLFQLRSQDSRRASSCSLHHPVALHDLILAIVQHITSTHRIFVRFRPN